MNLDWPWPQTRFCHPGQSQLGAGTGERRQRGTGGDRQRHLTSAPSCPGGPGRPRAPGLPWGKRTETVSEVVPPSDVGSQIGP